MADDRWTAETEELASGAQDLSGLVGPLLEAVNAIREYLAGPPAPDGEIRTWPLWAAEGDFAGGVWCGDDDCPLQAESSEIGHFREGMFTLDELHAAIGEHIARRREREREVTDDPA